MVVGQDETVAVALVGGVLSRRARRRGRFRGDGGHGRGHEGGGGGGGRALWGDRAPLRGQGRGPVVGTGLRVLAVLRLVVVQNLPLLVDGLPAVEDAEHGGAFVDDERWGERGRDRVFSIPPFSSVTLTFSVSGHYFSRVTIFQHYQKSF